MNPDLWSYVRLKVKWHMLKDVAFFSLQKCRSCTATSSDWNLLILYKMCEYKSKGSRHLILQLIKISCAVGTQGHQQCFIITTTFTMASKFWLKYYMMTGKNESRRLVAVVDGLKYSPRWEWHQILNLSSALSVIMNVQPQSTTYREQQIDTSKEKKITMASTG